MDMSGLLPIMQAVRCHHAQTLSCHHAQTLHELAAVISDKLLVPASQSKTLQASDIPCTPRLFVPFTSKLRLHGCFTCWCRRGSFDCFGCLLQSTCRSRWRQLWLFACTGGSCCCSCQSFIASLGCRDLHTIVRLLRRHAQQQHVKARVAMSIRHFCARGQLLSEIPSGARSVARYPRTRLSRSWVRRDPSEDTPLRTTRYNVLMRSKSTAPSTSTSSS